jgi:fused signal recognition particle receptor
MLELEGVVNILKKKIPAAPHEVLLVVDGTAGQNALKQAQDFHARVPLTGVIITKLDGSSKGGIVAAIESELGVPVCFVGVGEGESDLQIFEKSAFVQALLQETKVSAESGAHAEQRKRRKTRMDFAEDL